MICVSCHVHDGSRLCVPCRNTMRRGGERLYDGSLRVIAAFEHTGAATRLVHNLKYRGLTAYAELVAEVIAPTVEELPLVPVPRVWTRRIQYAVDPAATIAQALARRWNVPVLNALDRPLHTARRARGVGRHSPISFKSSSRVSGPVYVVDDVVTSGGTIRAVVSALGKAEVAGAVCANVVPRVSSLSV